MLNLKVRVNDLPPLLPLWLAPNSNRRKEGVTTVADLLHCGKTSVFHMVKRGEIKVVRLGKRKTLAVTASVIAHLESLTTSANGKGA